MATIVLHKPSRRTYIFLGTGFGAYKSQSPSFLGGSLFPHEESGEIHLASVCDRKGEILWFRSDELQVLEIDGQTVGRIFENWHQSERNDPDGQTDPSIDQCPACGTRIGASDQECPSCGLAFIAEEERPSVE